MDFRHLSAFRRVYRERDFSKAASELRTSRKSIVRMIENLENSFRCRLFESDGYRMLQPTPFAERLFNDLKPISQLQTDLETKISTIRESDRVLQIASSPAVFRTPSFCRLFREMQSVSGVRTSYSSIPCEDAAKSLISGRCDLYVGSWKGDPRRFTNCSSGSNPYHILTRKPNNPPDRATTLHSLAYLVWPNVKSPLPASPKASDTKWQTIEENQWLRWMDHPDECPEGTRIYAPQIPVDSTFWTISPNSNPLGLSQSLRLSFLRQHPYEFLPSLTDSIQEKMMVG